ncbi:MAG: hypothetical protein JW882_01905, partial [Deltaproteobacteria bacterium]|nr:hypothetical protein [Deltaproteobacteria bacterium]
MLKKTWNVGILESWDNRGEDLFPIFQSSNIPGSYSDQKPFLGTPWKVVNYFKHQCSRILNLLSKRDKKCPFPYLASRAWVQKGCLRSP